jgi:hypothetical protein
MRFLYKTVLVLVKVVSYLWIYNKYTESAFVGGYYLHT